MWSLWSLWSTCCVMIGCSVDWQMKSFLFDLDLRVKSTSWTLLRRSRTLSLRHPLPWWTTLVVWRRLQTKGRTKKSKRQKDIELMTDCVNDCMNVTMQRVTMQRVTMQHVTVRHVTMQHVMHTPRSLSVVVCCIIVAANRMPWMMMNRCWVWVAVSHHRNETPTAIVCQQQPTTMITWRQWLTTKWMCNNNNDNNDDDVTIQR